jgi:hypothetical protein
MMIPRYFRLPLLVLLLSFSVILLTSPFGSSSAASSTRDKSQPLNPQPQGPPNFDAFGKSKKRVAANAQASAQSQTEAGHIVQTEPRLGVPTFLWASEGVRGQARQLSTIKAQVGGDIESAARDHLGDNGSLYRLSGDDVMAARLVAVHDTGRGAIIAKFKQEIGGIEVFRDEINVVMNRDLKLVAITGYLTGDGDGSAPQNFSLQPAEALSKALEDLTGTALNPSALRGRSPVTAPGEAANPYTLYTADAGAAQNFRFSDEPARVKKVMYHLIDGYIPAYYIEVFVLMPSQDTTVISVTGDPHMTEVAYSYVISAVDGQLLFRNNLIAADAFTYRVWADPTTKIPYDTPAGNGAHPKVLPVPDGAQAPFVAMQDVTLQNFPFSQNDPWLAPGATQTNGNNVDAFVNLFSPDDIGTPTTTTPTDVPNGDHRAQISAPDSFLYTHQPDVDAFSANARHASITQLFYNINFLHDWFYDAGFDEASGNAQTNNYGRGGLGSDNMKGQAQDFQSFSNANMLTPADGSRPRMRMYNFPNLANTLDVQAPAGIASKLRMGISQTGLRNFDVTGDIVIATFTAGPTTCTITNAAALNGKIAMFDFDNTDGTGCAFSTRIARIHATGALAALMVYNSAPANANAVANITGINATHTKGIGVISWNSAAPIKTQLGGANTVSARLLRLADRDGALDNQIVFHEWGHYISNRLISNGSGLNNQQGAGMGEGWGDFIGMLLTVRPDDISTESNATWGGVYAQATYASSGVNFNGATNHGYYLGGRRTPYSTDMTNYNALTFKHIQDGQALPAGPPIATGGANSEVHNTGEVWTTMLWECYAALLRDTQGASPRLTFNEAQTRMKNYLVAAFKMTPPSPTFLEARDAVLAAAFTYDYNDGRLFAQAFAKRGAGVGAIAPDRFSTNNVGVTESFTSGGDIAFVSAVLDDSVDSCDLDGYLDSNEKGLLTVTVKNAGVQNLFNTTATVTSSNPHITFPNGNTITFPGSQPTQSVTATLVVAGGGMAGIETTDFTFTVQDSGSPTIGPITAHYFESLNITEIPAASATDTVEVRQTSWAISSNPTFGPVGPWRRSADAATSTNHFWHGTDSNAPSDEYLTSPVFTVDGSGSVNVQFDHSFGFEFDTSLNYDGGVIEMSVNGGAWTDVGGSAAGPIYNGTISNYANDVNPLKGRPGFVKNSNGTVHQSLTQAIAPGSTVRVRFRLGTDSSSGGAGWDIDNIVFTGVVETPFGVTVGQSGLCNPTPSPVVTIVLAPGTMPAGAVGTPYSATLTPSGGTAPYTHTITPVVLPPGLVSNVVGNDLVFSGTPTQAGTYLITVKTTDSASHQSSTNYTITINKGTPTITWSDPADITYGTALSGTQLNASTTMPGTLTYVPPSGTLLNAGAAQAITVNYVPTDTANYNSTSKTVHINVLKATPTINWSNPADITYGTALSDTQLNATSPVAGTFTYTPPATAVLSAGANQTLQVNFAPTDTVNYSPVSITVQINVLKAAPTITWSNPADIPYGTPLGATQLNATASVPGTLTYTPPAGTVLNAGAGQTLTANFIPSDAVNYNNASQSVTINVLKDSPVITWNKPADITYGTALSSTQLDATGPVAGAFTYTPPLGTILNAGESQNLSVNFAPTDTTNYNSTSKSVQINVLKATPAVTWSNPADITYGTPLTNAQLNATASIPGTFSYSPTAGTLLVIGNNQILSTSFTPTDTANYHTVAKTAVINVFKADQTITFNPLSSKTFGDAPFALSAWASSGLPVSFQIVSGPATLSVNTLTITGVGTVTVRALQAGGSNFNPATPVDQAFSVVKANSVIALSNLAHIYDGSAKYATVTTTPAGLSTEVTYTLSGSPVASPVNVGSYAVTATINDADYRGGTTGTLIINKATPVITWSAPSNIIFGTPLSGVQFNATASVPGTFQYSLPVGTVLSVGTYQLSVTLTPSDAAYYNTATGSVSLTILPVPLPTLSLSLASYNVVENGGSAAIVVNRAGDLSGPTTVNFTTSDDADLNPCNLVNGIASSRCDYAISVGTLRFAAGENTKIIYVPVVDDAFAESVEDLNIALSNPVGATLGQISTASVSITDNDTSNGPNPLDSVAFFVRQHYIDFLGREPDPIGYQGWQNILNDCPAGDINCDRIEVSSAFYRSEEFQSRGYFIYRFYSASLGGIPRYNEFLPDLAKVSGFLSAAELEANKVEFINEFMGRPAFQFKYGSLTDPTLYVEALLQTAGLPNHTLKATWIAGLTNLSLTQSQVLRQLIESSEVYQKYFNESFVVMQYFSYLRRNPDILYLNWIQIMNQPGSDYRTMINGFLNSAEYRQRFGQ